VGVSIVLEHTVLPGTFTQYKIPTYLLGTSYPGAGAGFNGAQFRESKSRLALEITGQGSPEVVIASCKQEAKRETKSTPFNCQKKKRRKKKLLYEVRLTLISNKGPPGPLCRPWRPLIRNTMNPPSIQPCVRQPTVYTCAATLSITEKINENVMFPSSLRQRSAFQIPVFALPTVSFCLSVLFWPFTSEHYKGRLFFGIQIMICHWQAACLRYRRQKCVWARTSPLNPLAFS
jgi:hypothetical protein